MVLACGQDTQTQEYLNGEAAADIYIEIPYY